jgi:hypothetical protein
LAPVDKPELVELVVDIVVGGAVSMADVDVDMADVDVDMADVDVAGRATVDNGRSVDL